MSSPSSSRRSRGICSSLLDQQVTGTTTLALIGVDVIHVVTDGRACSKSTPYMILGKNSIKTYDFYGKALATIAGDSITGYQLLDNVNKEITKHLASGEVPVDFVADAAADIAHQVMQNWQKANPNMGFPSYTIIVGWVEGQPTVHAVQGCKEPECIDVQGYGYAFGSGRRHVLDYYAIENPQPNKSGGQGRSDIELAQIAKRAAVFAALNDRYSGDMVHYVEVRKDKIHETDSEEVLKILYDEYDMFKDILSCFVFCIYRKSVFEYAADNEAKLSQAINTRFPCEIRRSHVLQTKEKYYIRVIKFQTGEAARKQFDSIKFEWRTKCGIGHTIDVDVHPYVRALPWIELHQLQGTPLVFARAKKKCIAHFLKL